jgi:L-ascorbate metabolism protein UlaG (beta-lactamase superfamily)
MQITFLGHSVEARHVIPCHYDTFPPIETDAQAFKADVERSGSSEVVVLAPGEVHTP